MNNTRQNTPPQSPTSDHAHTTPTRSAVSGRTEGALPPPAGPFPRLGITLSALAILLATLTLHAAENQPPNNQRQSNTQTPTRTPRPDYREKYSILTERNIFLKERRRPSQSDSRDRDRERERDRPRPEQTLALTGIVEEEGEFRAYFENLASPSFVRVSVGEPIARGKITVITLDAVEYEQEGQRRIILIGQDLTGTTSVRASPVYSTSTTGPTTGPSAGGDAAALNFDPNDPNLTVEQKMKVKRLREQGLIK
jgi:hypothetical protein